MSARRKRCIFLVLIFSMLLVCISCGKQVQLPTDQPGESAVILDVPYEYPITPSDPAWGDYTTPEKRAMCQIPEDVLAQLTTSTLLETVLEYPYLIDIYAFGPLSNGVSNLMQSFNGARELMLRDDAVSCLQAYVDARTIHDMKYEAASAMLDRLDGSDGEEEKGDWAQGMWQESRGEDTIYEAFTYPSAEALEEMTLDEIIAACYFSAEEAEQMTTKALAETLATHPLVYSKFDRATQKKVTAWFPEMEAVFQTKNKDHLWAYTYFEFLAEAVPGIEVFRTREDGAYAATQFGWSREVFLQKDRDAQRQMDNAFTLAIYNMY